MCHMHRRKSEQNRKYFNDNTAKAASRLGAGAGAAQAAVQADKQQRWAEGVAKPKRQPPTPQDRHQEQQQGGGSREQAALPGSRQQLQFAASAHYVPGR